MIAGATPGPARRLTCACTKFSQAPGTQDSHYDFRASRSLPALASLTPQLWDVFMRSMVHHMKQDISGSAQGASDPQFTQSLLALDDTVGRNISDFRSQLNAGAATSLFDRAIVADSIPTRMADPNHVVLVLRRLFTE